MSLRKKMLLLMILFLCGNAVALGVVLMAAPGNSAIESTLPVLGAVPPFSFPSSQGGEFGLEDLQGRIWVADFFFTSCGGPCPVMSGKLESLAQTFADDPRVQFVSFTVDADTDTPEVLKAYGAKYHAPPAKWHFLRPGDAAVQKIALDGFKVGSGDSVLIHSTRFILVDGKGQIRGYYTGTVDDDVAAMTEAIRELLKEPRS